MKKGKLILEDSICCIEFEQNPSVKCEEKTNKDGTKQLTGYQKWDPLKIEIINNWGYKLMSRKYNTAYLVLNNEANTFKLIDCFLDLEIGEISFKMCYLYQD